MEKVTEWANRNAKKLFIIVASFTIIAPIIIWFIYLIGRVFGGVATDITADGMLAYASGILSLLGTGIFAILSWSQNKTFEKRNRELEKSNRVLAQQSFLLDGYSQIKFSKLSIDLPKNIIRIYFESVGPAPVSKLKINSLVLYTDYGNFETITEGLVAIPCNGQVFDLGLNQSEAKELYYVVIRLGGKETSLLSKYHSGITPSGKPVLRAEINMEFYNPFIAVAHYKGEVVFEQVSSGANCVFTLWDSFVQFEIVIDKTKLAPINE